MTRWELSLHEAGHAVAAHVLTAGKPAAAVLQDQNSGMAWPLVEMTPTDRAIMTAAGPLAEPLADRHPAPELPPAIADRPPTVETIADAETAADFQNDLKRGVPDDVAIARWCISGIEGQPERWARRHVWVHSLAERLICNHERSIVEAARVLYLRGVVSLPLTERIPH